MHHPGMRRFRGKGIALGSTMDWKYFTQLYVNLRVIRDYAKSALPIEVESNMCERM